ncbi:MAG: prevent-host-death protein [Anaerolineae bacterium SG8_19]|nr:MAG: prevent-host-death protein [Anaerolineae bacterium SG8_19]
MNVYTYSEARQKLAKLLDQVLKEGAVKIKRRDGKVFVIRPDEGGSSPLDIPPVSIDISGEEIVEIVREGRRSRTDLPGP